MSDEIRIENPSEKIIRENQIETINRGNPIGESDNPPAAVAPDSDPAISSPTTTFEGENVNPPPDVVTDQKSIKTGDGQEVKTPDVADTETAKLIHAFIDKFIKNLDKNYPNWENDFKKLLLELNPDLNKFEPYRDNILTKPNWRIEPLQNLPPSRSPYWLKELAKEAEESKPSTPPISENQSPDQPPTAEPPTTEGAATDAKKLVEPDTLAQVKANLEQVLKDLPNQGEKPKEFNPSPTNPPSPDSTAK